MEWLNTIIDFWGLVLKWVFVFVLFLFAAMSFVVSCVSFETSYEERKMCKGKDFGWKFLILVAICCMVLALIFAFLGWLAL